MRAALGDGSDPRVAATFAADCAQRVLHVFEASCPGDDRPRKAIEAARAEVPLAEARDAASAAHAAARAAPDRASTWAARAAGHAAAAAHVARHAVHAAEYAARAEGATDERDWQLERFRRFLEELRR